MKWNFQRKYGRRAEESVHARSLHLFHDDILSDFEVMQFWKMEHSKRAEPQLELVRDVNYIFFFFLKKRVRHVR